MIRRDFVKFVIPLVALGPSIVFSNSEPQLSFGVIADPQYADKDTRGSRYYRASLEKLSSAIKDLNQEKLEFVVTLGDIIDADLKSFSDILPIYSKLKVPHNMVLGNHDWEVAAEDKGSVMETLGMKKNYFSEVIGKWRFIYLDGTDVSLFRNIEGSPEWLEAKAVLDELEVQELPQAQSWNGGISENQLNWLKDELESAKSANEHVIISNHYPLLPAKDAHNLWNSEEVLSLLDKYNNIVMYMNGHNHKGNYAVQNGTHYVNFKGMVETESETAYAIVKCYSDRVEVLGYGLEPNRVLS
jgi:predicted phosphodiesterase